jgi:hypothetical protein
VSEQANDWIDMGKRLPVTRLTVNSIHVALLVTLCDLLPGPHTINLRFLHPDGVPIHEPRPPINVVASSGISISIAITRVECERPGVPPCLPEIGA